MRVLEINVKNGSRKFYYCIQTNLVYHRVIKITKHLLFVEVPPIVCLLQSIVSLFSNCAIRKGSTPPIECLSQLKERKNLYEFNRIIIYWLRH